jgi:hypothetical protein
MNGHPHHPGTEELAEFRAGTIEAARSDQIAAHTAECPGCASVTERLDQVPAILASIPAPAMPADLEARIIAALAAEAAHRVPQVIAAASPTPDSSATSSPQVTSPSPSASPTPLSPAVLTTASLSPAAARRRVRRRPNVTAPLGVLVAAAACLMLAFVGYRLSNTGHPASSSAAAGSASSHPAGNSPASGPHRDNLTPSGAIGGPASTASFVVLVSSTNFRKATLQEQVTQQLTAERSTPASPGGTFLPGGQVGSGPLQGRKAIPSQSLVGCVTRLLGHTKPALVEQATYQSVPVYMIAMADHAWVVARDCTAANPQVLASVALPAR